jgi:hypothetical protein
MGSETDVVKSFVAGTYILSYSQELSRGSDTLVISSLSNVTNTYRVRRKVSYQRIHKGRLLPKEIRQEQWVCTYQPVDKVLYDFDKGRMISFAPESEILFVGNKEYKKISGY